MSNLLLGLSVAFNACFGALALVMLHRRGGLVYLKRRFLVRSAAQTELDPVQRLREDVWSSMPACEGGWLFLGDSLIDFAPLQELFVFQVISRGRSGDRISDVAARLAEIRRHRPQRIVLWIGLNDLVAGRSSEEILDGIVALVEAIKREATVASLTLVGVPLVSRAKSPAHADLNRTAAMVNCALRARFPGPEPGFIDPQSALTDRDGNLRTEFSLDGTHLNGAGYLAWRDMLLRDLPV